MQNRKEIGRLFIKILKFIPFLLIVYSTLLFIWGYNIPRYLRGNINYRIESRGHAFSRFKEVKNYGKVDILFLGSSHTYRGFDVRLFEKQGFRVFNLGSSSQTPIQTNILVDRYLALLNPDIVFYEVNLPDFSSDGVEASLDLIANDNIDWKTAKMALTINHLKTYNSLIYGYLYQISGCWSLHNEPLQKYDDTYIIGGYVEKELTYYKSKNRRVRGDEINPFQLKYFEQIIDKIKDRGVKLYLVQAPMTIGYYNSLTNAEMFDSLMRTYGNYVNFNEIMHLNDTLHFFDAHHMNQLGVEIFNNDLIERFFNKNKIQTTIQ